MLLNKLLEKIEYECVCGTVEREVNSVVYDSRKVSEGCLFICIRGANFDGHEFAAEVVDKGAKVLVISRDVELPKETEKEVTLIKVADTRYAMAFISAAYFDYPAEKMTVIGITGSVGKTTTKEMVHAVMSVKYNTLKNEGNLNNEIGVPLTLFRLDETHEAAVIEMGMSGFEEIARMTAAVRPDVAVISNIGVSHIENLGSREGILKAKFEILESMKADAPVILNGDDDMLVTVCAGAHPITYYGINNEKCKW